MSDVDRERIDRLIACLEEAVTAVDELTRLQRDHWERTEATWERSRSFLEEVVRRPSPFVRPEEGRNPDVDAHLAGAADFVNEIMAVAERVSAVLREAERIVSALAKRGGFVDRLERIRDLLQVATDTTQLRARTGLSEEDRATLRRFQAEAQAGVEASRPLPPGASEEEVAPLMRAGMEGAVRSLEWLRGVVKQRGRAAEAWNAERRAALAGALELARRLAGC